MKFIKELLNLLLRFLRENAPDPILKGCIVFGRIGAVLLVSGGLAFAITIINGNVTFNVDVTLKDISVWVVLLGSFILILSMGMYFRRTSLIESRFKKALFYYPGFENSTKLPPIYSLPPKDRNALPEDIKPFDSYNKERLQRKLELIKESLEHKNTLNEINKGYFAVLGSVPFLYALGTLFNDGKVSHELLRHRKDQNKWELMDAFDSENIELVYEVNGIEYVSVNEAIEMITPNSDGQIGLAVSFTQRILPRHIPNTLEPSNVVYVRLNRSGYDREAISSNQGLDKVSAELDKLQRQLSARSTEVKLFLSAQATLVFRLGMCYQPGMSGKVSIYNFDSTVNSYAWAVSVTPQKSYLII